MAATNNLATGTNKLATGKASTVASELPERVKIFWAKLPPQQRRYIIAAAVLAVVVLAVFGKMIATPDYKPLMTGLEPQDVQTISSELTAKNIKFQVGSDGKSINVPADQLEAARLEVASHNSVNSGRIGYEIFDKLSWGQTEFDEKVNYQRALEGELERTIQTISNVKSVRVHLVMANESVFSDEARAAKASVTLHLKRGSLSREEVAQISHLVAGSVDNLDPKDVVVTDADSENASAGGDQSGPEDGLEGALTRRLIATLSPVVGGNHLRASVNVEYENRSSEESEEKYDPTVSVPLTMQRSEETSGSNPNAGVPGTASNVPSAKQASVSPVSNGTGPSSKTESATYGVNKTTRHEVDPAGAVRRITAAIVLDDAVVRKQEKGQWTVTHVKRSPEEISTITALAQAAIGFNGTRGDVVTVQNLSFDRENETDNVPATFLERARNGLNDFTSVVRYAVLFGLFLVVYLLMFRPLQKRILAADAPSEAALPAPDHEPAQEQVQAPAVNALEAHANALQRSLTLKRELTEFVQNDPEGSAAAVRAWLQEEAG